MAKPYDVTFDLTSKSVVVQPTGGKPQEGFEHLGTVDRPDPGEVGSPTDVLFHAVRDMLYHQGVKDMAAVTIRVVQDQNEQDPAAFVPEQAKTNFKPSGSQEPGQVNEVKSDKLSPVDTPETEADAQKRQAEENAEPEDEDVLELKVGETVQLEASEDARFESSDEDIASVDAKGLVRGQSAGDALVAVAEGDETKTYTVKVYNHD